MTFTKIYRNILWKLMVLWLAGLSLTMMAVHYADGDGVQLNANKAVCKHFTQSHPRRLFVLFRGR